MLAWAAGDLVTASETLRASDLVSASGARMASLARIEGTSNEELQEIVQACQVVSAKVDWFNVRVRALLAVMPGLASVRDATAIPCVAAIRHVAAIRNEAETQDVAAIRNEAVTQDLAAMRNERVGNRAVA